jgi:hypothetical protein
MAIAQSLGTARATIDVANTVGDEDRMFTGSGVVDLGRGWSDLTWTGEGSVRELVTREGTFLSGDVDGRWLAFPDGTPTSRIADVFDGLVAVPVWSAAGAEQIGTGSATRFTGVLRDWSSGLGLNDAEAEALLAAGATIDISAWVDGQGRLVRILRVLQPVSASAAPAQTPIRASTLIDLTDFGIHSPIDSPDPAMVSTP